MCDLKKPFGKRSPCNDCPYKKDTPLEYWAVEEFMKSLLMDGDEIGATFGCHKNDGNMCIGWLMYQIDNDLPSVALRLVLRKHNISREYLNSLTCQSERYKTVLEMCKANYPEAFNVLKKIEKFRFTDEA